MTSDQRDLFAKPLSSVLPRRMAIHRMVAVGAGALAGGWALSSAKAQDASPVPSDTCVATAPSVDASGIGFVQLLVGGIVHDMPAGPVEIRLSRLAMAPGTSIEAMTLPYPALMYIETGTTACPGGPGRVGYAADGTVLEVTADEGIQYTSAGSTQYIPANVADGAGNEGNTLMSSIIIEFVPVDASTVTPVATPAG